MQTQQEAFNQGIYAAAQRYEAPHSEVLAELERINERGQLARLEANGKAVVPHTEPELPWPPLDKVLVAAAKPVLKLSVLASGVYVVVVSAAAVGAAVMAFVSENAMVIGGGVLALAALIGGIGSLFASGGGEASETSRTSHTGQNITVNVNVGGHDVNTK